MIRGEEKQARERRGILRGDAFEHGEVTAAGIVEDGVHEGLGDDPEGAQGEAALDDERDGGDRGDQEGDENESFHMEISECVEARGESGSKGWPGWVSFQ